MSVEILSNAVQLYEKLHLQKLAAGEWLWKLLKVIGIAAIRQTIITLPNSGLYCSIATMSLCFYFTPFPRYCNVFPKFKRVTWPWTYPLWG